MPVDSLSIYNDALLKQYLWSVPRHLLDSVATDGSVSVNTAWEQHLRDNWYPEQQRGGADWVIAGIKTADTFRIMEGLKVIGWGWKQQGPDGNFPSPPADDVFHSSSFFLEAAARAALVLSMHNPTKYASVIKDTTARSARLAAWMIRPDVATKGRTYNKPYTHRRYLVAAALGTTAHLLTVAGRAEEGEKFWQEADGYISEGLSLQSVDGVNPEKGGYDSSYQAAGIVFMHRIALLHPDPVVQKKIREAARKASDWLATRVNPDGTINTTGDTRSNTEPGRTGTAKTIDVKSIGLALLIQAAVLPTRAVVYRPPAQRAFAKKWP